MRNRPWILFLATLSIACPAAGQIKIVDNAAQLDTLASSYRVDFAIPDAPAFDLIEVEDADILRPATVREFAVHFADFARDGGFGIPSAFAVEAAPFLLAHGRSLSLTRYQARPWLYRLRLSGATGRDSLERSTAALGLRVTLLDRADPRSDNRFLTQLTTLTTGINREYVKARIRLGPTASEITLNEEEDRAVRALVAQVDSLAADWADRTWNAPVMELALGSRALAGDSTGADLRAADFAGWLTYGHPVGTWGQLLLGLRGAAERDHDEDDYRAATSLGARLYLGRNRLKGFVEAQGEGGTDSTPGWFVNAGGEARGWQGIWASFSAGLDWPREDGSSNPRLTSRFTVKLAVPELTGS